MWLDKHVIVISDFASSCPIIKIKDDQLGHLIKINSNYGSGIYLISSIGPNRFSKLGKDNTLRVFKGSASSSYIPGIWSNGGEVTSSIMYQGHELQVLRAEKTYVDLSETDQCGYALYDRTDALFLLYINRHGLYRYSGLPSKYIAPVDKDGRLQVIRP